MASHPAVTSETTAVVRASGRRVWLAAATAVAMVMAAVGPTAAPAYGQEDATNAAACPAGGVPSAGFTDVIGNVHEPAINCVTWHGLAEGVSVTAYAPRRHVRRDQMASFLTRLLEAANAALPPPQDQGFHDVHGNTHEAAINQLAELGIVKGINPDAYGPDQPVRRDQMASFLVRAYEHVDDSELAAPPSGFHDTENTPHETSIDKAAAAGFARGTGTGTYRPAALVHRDQMASFLTRVLERGVADGHVAPREPRETPRLSPGDSGAEVHQLQERLVANGYWLGTVDGRYGSLTRQAVMAFQETYGFPPSGIYDERTRGLLERDPPRPQGRSTSGRWIEIDLERQILMLVVNGQTQWVFNTSTGHGEVYTFQGQQFRATTTTGRHQITRQIDGLREAARGRLWRPKYFDSSRGIAVHGSGSVPAEPVSAGCVRVTNQAMDFIWEQNLAPIGTQVWVYPEDHYR